MSELVRSELDRLKAKYKELTESMKLKKAEFDNLVQGRQIVMEEIKKYLPITEKENMENTKNEEQKVQTDNATDIFSHHNRNEYPIKAEDKFPKEKS